jgi:uncharacterized protein
MKVESIEDLEKKKMKAEPQSTKALKYLLIVVGLFFVALGLVGIIIPGLPTTIFLIAAAACFAKSSPCLHAWLMSHPWFGAILTNWQETKTIPKKAKCFALLSMLAATIYTFIILDDIWLKSFIVLLMLAPALFVYRLPLTENLKQ